MNVLNVKGLYKKFSDGKEVINDLSFTLAKGQCLGIVGESGCGKSTLCRAIAGFEKIQRGSIEINQFPVKFGQKNLHRSLGPLVQMVFQDCVGSVNPTFTAFEVIEAPLKNLSSLSKENREKRVLELLDQVGISSNQSRKYMGQFSGGQIQRICIARALSIEPKLILLDEPTSSLDVSVQAQILNLLKMLKQNFDLSYVFISHDIEATYYLSDAIAVMYRGQIVEYIENVEHFKSMCHPYTKNLMDSVLVSNPSETVSLFKNKLIESNRLEMAANKGCVYAHLCAHASELCFAKRPSLFSIKEGHAVACHKKEAGS